MCQGNVDPFLLFGFLCVFWPAPIAMHMGSLLLFIVATPSTDKFHIIHLQGEEVSQNPKNGQLEGT